MRLLAIGCGGMGGNGIRMLQNLEGVEAITVADLSQEAADSLAADLNFPDVSAVQLDATDAQRVTELASKHDLVFNAVGPFSRFGLPIMEAVIRGGANYIDVNDDFQAVEAAFDLNDMAKKAGVTALVAMGQAPGITNMMAKYVAEGLDEVDNLKTFTVGGIPPVDMVRGTPHEDAIAGYAEVFASPGGLAEASPGAWAHMIESCQGDITVWKGGKRDKMPAWESGEYIDFAEPFGRQAAYYLGHPEPITLPRYIKINNFSACMVTLGQHIDERLRLEARGHAKPLDPPEEPNTPVWEAPEKWQNMGVWGGTAVVAEGLKDGHQVRHTARLNLSIFDRGVATFGGQAVGIHLLSKDNNRKPGVYGPEGLFETDDFFNALVPLFNKVNEWHFTLDELIPVQREVLVKA